MLLIFSIVSHILIGRFEALIVTQAKVMTPKDSSKNMQPILPSLIQQHRSKMSSNASDNTMYEQYHESSLKDLTKPMVNTNNTPSSSGDDDNFQEHEDESRACRHQFISEYKQNKLYCATYTDKEFIAKCQTVSYEGDCKFDAKLYTVGDGDARTDVEVYICLYGLHPSIVEKIGKWLTSTVILLYADTNRLRAHHPGTG